MWKLKPFPVVLVAVASAVSLLLSGCLMSPEQDEVGTDYTQDERRAIDQLGHQLDPKQEHESNDHVPSARNYGKADNAKQKSSNPDPESDESKADQEAASNDKCPKPEDGELPHDKCPARGVEHGSPQPLDPADTPKDGDRPEAPTDENDDDDSE